MKTDSTTVSELGVKILVATVAERRMKNAPCIEIILQQAFANTVS
jgi:hypothetical protein